MLAVIFCLVGAAALVGLGEYLGKHKLLKGENQRKFIHITVGSFIAFWPWLISWRQIQIIGLVMLAVILASRYHKAKFFHFHKNAKRETYGDIFFALAIIFSALLTDVKIFFALAILNMALADGLAAIIGLNFGKRWRYKVYYHTKTVLGTMTFWIISTCIFGVGLLFAHDLISFTDYALIVVFLPPVLAVLENIFMLGMDDLVIPLAVIAVLSIAQMN